VGGVDGVLFGHDELKGASKDPRKECPGRFVSMNSVRAEVAVRVDHIMANTNELEREELLRGAGFSI